MQLSETFFQRQIFGFYAQNYYGNLKDKGKLVIQFYPKSQEELMKTARTFKREGFQGQVIVDNPKNPKKRVIYLVMNRV